MSEGKKQSASHKASQFKFVLDGRHFGCDLTEEQRDLVGDELRTAGIDLSRIAERGKIVADFCKRYRIPVMPLVKGRRSLLKDVGVVPHVN